MSDEYKYCPNCEGANLIVTDYEDENGEEDLDGCACEDCRWEGDVSELQCANFAL
jgi:hypothetical protein